MERPTIEGDSPVDKIGRKGSGILSTTGHVKSLGKQGGPPSKAKYVLMTDSAQVP